MGAHRAATPILWKTKCCFGERSCQLDAVLGAGSRHSPASASTILAGNRRVSALLRSLRRVPQRAGVSWKLSRCAFRQQQHLMVLGRVAVAENNRAAPVRSAAIELAGAWTPPSARRNHPCCGRYSARGQTGWPRRDICIVSPFRKSHSPCNAYCVCTLSLTLGSLVQNPLRGPIVEMSDAEFRF